MQASRFHFLSHLGEQGMTNIHPFGQWASLALIEHLDLKPKQTVLEIGCGTGETLILVAQSADATIIGVDILPSMLTTARQRLRASGYEKAILTAFADISSLPFKSESFDRIYAESVIGFHSATDINRMLNEIKRLLKPGGIFVANEAIWKTGIDPGTVSQIHSRCVKHFGSCQASIQPWDIYSWIRCIQHIGLEVISSDTIESKTSTKNSNWLAYTHAMKASGEYTKSTRKIRWSSLRILIAAIYYKYLLLWHRNDGRFIEGRLFVLKKPQMEMK